ncbi:MAG: hypothetical protein ABSA05_07170 [Opitutaceae bacterium]
MTRRRSAPDPFSRLVAAGCIALVLALTVLAASPPLHAWLHGEKALDADDDCAIVLFAQGVTPVLAAALAMVIALRAMAEDLPAPLRLHLEAPRFELPPGCGPPQS